MCTQWLCVFSLSEQKNPTSTLYFHLGEKSCRNPNPPNGYQDVKSTYLWLVCKCKTPRFVFTQHSLYRHQLRCLPSGGAAAKNVACCASALAPSPTRSRVATEWTRAVPSPPATLHGWAAFCPVPGNPDSSFARLEQSRHAGQVWAPEQENRCKEAKPVWPVLVQTPSSMTQANQKQKREAAWGLVRPACLGTTALALPRSAHTQ